MTKSLWAMLITAFISACSGVGIPATDDPYAKISQAEYLYSGPGRAAQARRLLNEAIATFQEKGDDAGLAAAYRQYGFLARLEGARDDVIFIRKSDPKTAPPREDLDLSDNYFKRSVDLFLRTNRPDMASNVYYNLGVNSYFRGERPESCAYMDKALEASRQAAAQQPGRAVDLPRGVRSYAEWIGKAKAEAGCS